MTLYPPMLAKLCEVPTEADDRLYEAKLDGFRVLAYYDGLHSPTLINRAGHNVTERFPDINWHFEAPCVVDGEMVAYDQVTKVADFQQMQRRLNRKHDIASVAQQVAATYVAFDIVELAGKSLLDTPLLLRKRALCEAMTPTDNSLIIPYQREGCIQLLAATRDAGGEGIMSKLVTSKYKPGRRTNDWLKLKVRRENTFMVVGATYGTGHRASQFGALIVALPTEEGWHHMGEVGTGYTEEAMVDIQAILDSLTVPASPLTLPQQREVRQAVKQWVQPVLKVRVSYLELSNAGKLRHPSFEGFVK